MRRDIYRRLSKIRKEQVKTMVALKRAHRMDIELSAIVGQNFQAMQECNLGEAHDAKIGTTRKASLGQKPEIESNQ